MKISIVIAVYNVSGYINDCLASIAAQTWKGDTEVLLVDDCGLDDSMAKAESFISSYSGHQEYRIIRMDHNSGVGAARNAAIREATGTHLLLVDSDDRIEPRCLEWFVETAHAYPGVERIDGLVVGSPSGACYDFRGQGSKNYEHSSRVIARNILKSRYSVTPWNKLILLDFLRRNDLYFKEGVIYEDGEWHYRMSTRLHSWALCRHETYVYNSNPQSITNTRSTGRNITSRLKILKSNIEDVCSRYAGMQRRYIMNNLLYLSRQTGLDGYREEYDRIKDLFFSICPLSSLVRRLWRDGKRGSFMTEYILKAIVSMR